MAAWSVPGRPEEPTTSPKPPASLGWVRRRARRQAPSTPIGIMPTVTRVRPMPSAPNVTIRSRASIAIAGGPGALDPVPTSRHPLP